MIVSNINFQDLIPYCIFPNSFIRNGNLTVHERMLFEVLCSYDHLDKNKQRKGWCDPSLARLAKDMGCSKRTVQYHLKKLVEKGLVVIVYRNNSTTDKKNPIYILNILPGLSETDKKRIAHSRTVEIRHLISGLNIVRVKTSKGMQYVTPEEFDLEYLVTGQRTENRDVIEGEIATLDDIDNMLETSEPDKKEEQKEEDDDMKISFKRINEPLEPIKLKESKPTTKQKQKQKKDPVAQILAGNYEKINAKDLALYFKYVYELTYLGEFYAIDYKKDLRALKLKQEQLGTELLCDLIKYFVTRYKDLFYSEEYKRPRIYHLNIAWVFNKLMENYSFYKKGQQTLQSPSQLKDYEIKIF